MLASSPEDVLGEAKAIVLRFGGHAPAGDKDDFFNKDLLFQGSADKVQVESWKTGMKGKLFATFDVLENIFGKDTPLVSIAIAGGPACDWERSLLVPATINPESLRRRYPQLRLKVCTTPQDMEAFLKRGAPLEECM